MDFYTGEVILINKPLTWTSFQVVNKMKYLIRNSKSQIRIPDPSQANNTQRSTNKLKIGHAGTLDPLATGLLIVCTGKQTKNIETYQAQEKEYTGTFYIGATTPCFDLEKPIEQNIPVDHITDELIIKTNEQFIGCINQTQP